MRGYRNLVLGLAYLACCAFLGYQAGAEHIGELAGVFSGIGVGVVGIVAGRAANKWADRDQ